ncbi:MAG TPA: hypothetical protein V6C97_31870, partial [Oculatellaceae cyanobacterium]
QQVAVRAPGRTVACLYGHPEEQPLCLQFLPYSRFFALTQEQNVFLARSHALTNSLSCRLLQFQKKGTNKRPSPTDSQPVERERSAT